MFNDMLRTQLLLKNIITPEDWEVMSEHIQYDFLYDNHFSELKEAELMNERLSLAATAEPYVGKYYSQDYVRRKILRQTDIEIIEQDKLIEDEIKKGVIPRSKCTYRSRNWSTFRQPAGMIWTVSTSDGTRVSGWFCNRSTRDAQGWET